MITLEHSNVLFHNSLGAALSSMASFQLAGEDFDWLPKPITCISYASPMIGTTGFRTAFEVRRRIEVELPIFIPC